MKIFIDKINSYKDDDYLYFLKEINTSRKKEINKIKNVEKRKQSILGEVLLMKALKENQIDYQKIKIIKNENGKPYIKDSSFKYNISHSGEYVCLGASVNDIGIDIEKIRDIDMNVINFFANETEKKWILEKDVRKRLFTLYTLKESYIKMKGQTINSLLDIEFVSNNQISCSDKNINYIVNKDIPNYIISICEKDL